MATAFLATNGKGTITTSADLTFTTTRRIEPGEHVVVTAYGATGRVSIGTITVGSLSLAKDVEQGTNSISGIWSARATSAIALGSTVTVHTSTTTASYLGANCFSLQGLIGITYKDKTSSTSGTSPSASSGATATTVQAIEIVIGCVGLNADAAITVTGGFTSIDTARAIGTAIGGCSYLDTAITGAQTATFTIGASNYGAAVCTYIVTNQPFIDNNYRFVKVGNGMSVTEKIR